MARPGRSRRSGHRPSDRRSTRGVNGCRSRQRRGVPLRLRPHPGGLRRGRKRLFATLEGGDPRRPGSQGTDWLCGEPDPAWPMWAVPHPDPPGAGLRPPVRLQPPAPVATAQPVAVARPLLRPGKGWPPPAPRGLAARLLRGPLPAPPLRDRPSWPRPGHTGGAVPGRPRRSSPLPDEQQADQAEQRRPRPRGCTAAFTHHRGRSPRGARLPARLLTAVAVAQPGCWSSGA